MLPSGLQTGAQRLQAPADRTAGHLPAAKLRPHVRTVGALDLEHRRKPLGLPCRLIELVLERKAGRGQQRIGLLGQ